MKTCPLSRDTTPHGSKVTVATLGVRIILLLLLLCCMWCVLRCDHPVSNCLAYLLVCWSILQVWQLLHLDPVSLIPADLLPAQCSKADNDGTRIVL